MRQPGRVYMRQAGTSEEWRDVGSATGFSVASEVNEPVKPILTGGFTFSTKDWDPEVLKLYYGADFVKFAGANNRGETRKEEKHMGVRKFKSVYGQEVQIKKTFSFEGAVSVSLRGQHVALEKADVPLIAHALFEKSGWPDAVQDDDGDYEVMVDRRTAYGMAVKDQSTANLALARAIANLAAYNAWVEGTAEREAAEALAEVVAREAEAEAARKREHDDLRTSAIALEALALYNEGFLEYKAWDDVQYGAGASDEMVRRWIAKAEAARAAKPAPKVGDRVRVSADAKTVNGGSVHFGGEDVEGVVVSNWGGDIDIKATTARWTDGITQFVDPKYVTVVATAEDLAAEKAKAERDAGIDAILKADPLTGPFSAERMYDRGIRATA